MDNRIIVLLTTIASVLIALVIGAALGSNEFFVPVLTLIVIGTVLLVASPHIGVFLAIALYASGLTAPGLPGQFGLFYVSVSAVVGCALLLVLFRRAPIAVWSPVHMLLLVFSAVVLFTGLYRGLGFQFLGSSMWGGFLYIQVLAAAFLVFAMPRVNMPASWWPKAIVIMGLLAPLPLVADLLVLKGFSFGFIRMFLQTGATIGNMIAEQEAGGGLGRLTSAGIAAQSMVIAFLAIVPTARLFSLRSLPAILILIAMIALSLTSGFRLMTAMLVFVVFLAAFFQRTITGPRVILGLLATSFALVVLYTVSYHLPLNVQRALSWLPGIEVASSAVEDAEGTITWRLDLWREAIRYIPDFFFIGKGFSYDGNLFLAAQGGYASYDALNWALVTGAYHNGYLSLLLLTGVVGLVSGLALLVSLAIRQIRIEKKSWNNPALHRCYQAFLASQLCWILVYLTVYGDVPAVFPQVLFAWAAMDSLRACDERYPRTTEPATLRTVEGEFSHLE